MSDHTNWSPSYTAWKLLETILEGKGVKPTDLGKELLLDLFSDCVNSVSGEYVADIEDIDDELDDDDFEDDVEGDD
ncbi:MAG: hypothetical protein CMK07_14230 [Ponticaulis sp.]|nr:hypothetical protein [Ponticaulis sp.]